MFSIVYRVLELVIRMAFRHRLFILLWPLGRAFSHADVHHRALLGYLERTCLAHCRNCTANFRCVGHFQNFGREGRIRSSTLELFSLAQWYLLFCCCSPANIGLGGQQLTPTANLVLGFAGVIIFGATLFVLKPLRPAEYEHLLRILPRSWPIPTASFAYSRGHEGALSRSGFPASRRSTDTRSFFSSARCAIRWCRTGMPGLEMIASQNTAPTTASPSQR